MYRSIPNDFLMGVATSSFQIEGALTADGRTPSIWDNFPVQDNDTGEEACEHYKLYKQDVQIMKEMAVDAYRFSIAWPRVHPHSDKKVNEKGLDFYDRLTDELLDQGITPWATLFHWDLPIWMHEMGGWENRQIVDYFEAYVTDCVARLGDRVKHWFTLNEPWCSSILGYQTGEHAPGLQLEQRRVLNLVHNHLLAHGAAMRAIRAHDSKHLAGPVLNPWIPIPLTNSKEDIEAADIAWTEHVGWWFEPIFFGAYPEKVADLRQLDLPLIEDGDFDLISTKNDFLGLNLYFPGFVRHDPYAEPFPYKECRDLVNLPRTEMDWQVYPPVLTYALEKIHRLYSPGPIYVTENGCAMDDRPDSKGQVHDLWRKEYLRTHIDQLMVLREYGVPVEGYFAWSLLDNFEWQYGYSKRFGLIRVDYETQERTWKSSARWYQSVVKDRKLYSL